jgi:hypothetical protein
MATYDNIHARIKERLKSNIAGARSVTERKRWQKEYEFEIRSAKRPSQGMWVLTDFGLHIDPANDIGLMIPKKHVANHKDRSKYENRGAALENTKIPHILTSLLYKKEGGAKTGEILDDIWFTTSFEFYNNKDHLVAQSNGKHRKAEKMVKKSNKTIQYFKGLLNWPSLEPIIEFVPFEPDPETFRAYSSDYESLGEIVKSAIRHGFTVHAQEGGSQYVIALPEKLDQKTLVYDPDKTKVHAVLELPKSKKDDLVAKLLIGGNSAPYESPGALLSAIDAYGGQYYLQRLRQANLKRRSVGLPEIDLKRIKVSKTLQ